MHLHWKASANIDGFRATTLCGLSVTDPVGPGMDLGCVDGGDSTHYTNHENLLPTALQKLCKKCVELEPLAELGEMDLEAGELACLEPQDCGLVCHCGNSFSTGCDGHSFTPMYCSNCD